MSLTYRVIDELATPHDIDVNDWVLRDSPDCFGLYQVT